MTASGWSDWTVATLAPSPAPAAPSSMRRGCRRSCSKPRQAPAHLADMVRARLGPGASTVDLTDVAVGTIGRLGLDALVAIGGDGTLTFARRLHAEGMQVIGVPKTMDNDVFGTDYCVGFSTAVSRSVHYIDELRTVAGSHERYLVVAVRS